MILTESFLAIILLVAFGGMLFASVFSLHYITGYPNATPRPHFEFLDEVMNGRLHRLIKLIFAIAHIIVLWSAMERILSIIGAWMSAGTVNIAAETLTQDFVMGMAAGALICGHIAWLLQKSG
jgi:hypothetical protein